MRRLLISLGLILVLALPSVASDAPSAWNNNAAAYNFSPYPASATASFTSQYHGSDFETDFAGIKAALAAEVEGYVPPWNGDDLLNGSLESYP